jgi:hypothetical protein
MCLSLEAMGHPVEVHHHEVATAGQCEIGVLFNTLVRKADEVQRLKYVVQNVAAELWQDRHLHAQAAGRRQWQRDARSPVAWPRMASTCSPAISTPACPKLRCTTSAGSSSTPRR